MFSRIFTLIVICILVGLAGVWWRLPSNSYAPIFLDRQEMSEQENTPIPALLAGKKMDINQVSAQELKQIPRLSRTSIEAIINFREKHGPITSIDQLDTLKGIGPKTLIRLHEFTEVKIHPERLR